MFDGEDLFVMDAIMDERRRQYEKWGDQIHSRENWMVILGEEFGEACRAVFEKDDEEFLKELIQVAAVAAAAVKDYQRAR